MPPGPETLVLNAGDLSCWVAPAMGGSLLRFDYRIGKNRTPLMRPAPDPVLSPLDSACFPLIPFSNRIADGQFVFAGQPVSLPANIAGIPHPLHGHGWLRAWTVLEQGPDRVVLTYRHDPDAWPWPYRALLTYTLKPDSLTGRLELHNTGTAPFPAGIGFHPYFPKSGDATLKAGISSVWHNDAAMLPRRLEPVPPEWDFRESRSLALVTLDNGFPGWDGHAELRWPQAGLCLRLQASASLRHLVIYAPTDQDFVCIEPVSHMTDAVNRHSIAGSGLTVLPAGEALSGEVCFSLSALLDVPAPGQGDLAGGEGDWLSRFSASSPPSPLTTPPDAFNAVPRPWFQ